MKKHAVSAACLLLILSALYAAFTAALDHDEVEHMHAAWLTWSGYVQYRDFFENHGHLLYALFSPVFSLIEKPEDIILIFRIVSLTTVILTVLCFSCLFRDFFPEISRKYFFVFLLSSFMFMTYACQFRPDLIMTLCFAGSSFLFFRAEITEKKYLLVISGFIAGLGADFLIKAVIYMPAFFLSAIQKQVQEKNFHLHEFMKKTILFFAGFIVAAGLFIAWTSGRDLLEGYLFFTFHFNKFYYLQKGAVLSFSLSEMLAASLEEDTILWIFAVIGIIVLAKYHRNYKTTFILSCLVINFLFLLENNQPNYQNIFPVVPILAFISVTGFETVRKTAKFAVLRKILPAVLLILIGMTIVRSISVPPMENEISVMKFIIDRTDKKDAVFVSPPYHPIIRKDAVFFWFNNVDTFSVAKFTARDRFLFLLKDPENLWKSPPKIFFQGKGIFHRDYRLPELLERYYYRTEIKDLYIRTQI
jgi:hypothetical protein